MPRDYFPNNIESRNPKKRYAEEIYASLPEFEPGVNIPRVYPTLLVGGKDTKIQLSIADRLGHEGWDADQVSGSRIGSLLQHRNGDVYEVTAVNKRDKRLEIRNRSERGLEGAIIAAPMALSAHEYVYKLRDNAGHSKKIKVFDTVIKRRDLRTSEFINTLVSAIPAQCMEVFDEIQIHRQNTKAGSFRAEPSLTSERRILNLYVSEDLRFVEDAEYPTQEAIETLYHELGHAIVKYLKGSTHPGRRWRKAMEASGNSVSEYASKTRYSRRKGSKEDDHGEVEDIAETFRFYFATDGAKVLQAQPLREFVRPRFEELDEAMDYLGNRKNDSLLRKHIFKPTNPLEK